MMGGRRRRLGRYAKVGSGSRAFRKECENGTPMGALTELDANSSRRYNWSLRESANAGPGPLGWPVLGPQGRLSETLTLLRESVAANWSDRRS